MERGAIQKHKVFHCLPVFVVGCVGDGNNARLMTGDVEFLQL